MAEMAMKEKNKKPRARFYMDRSGIWTQLAIICMLLSAIFRLIGVWGLWEDEFFRATQILLPLCCNLLFALFLFIFCTKGFFMTSFPVLLGVAFFIIKALGFGSWIHTALCILLYVAVAVIYTGTVFGLIRTKWLLPPLFGLPFLYHIFVEDLGMIKAGSMTLVYGLQEISVLFVMLGMFCVGMGLKRKKSMEEANLPKIKDPIVVPPKTEAPEESQDMPEENQQQPQQEQEKNTQET